MATLAQTLAHAIQQHQTGQLAVAEGLYRQVLSVDSKNAVALHLLGVIASQTGRHDQAIQQISAAIGLRNNDPEMYGNLGSAYMSVGRTAEAASCYQKAIQLRPTFAPAHYNLGNVLLKQGRAAEAVASYQRALQFNPGDVGTLLNLGSALQDLGNLGGAIECFTQVVQRQPTFGEARTNLANALAEQGRLADAIIQHREAVRLRPNLPDTHFNLGNTLRLMGQIEEAVGCFRRTLQLAGDHADAHFGLGLALLLMGQWEQGWQEYEWRWRTKPFRLPSYTHPRWDGADLGDRTILLNIEQGMGDTIQFVRYAPLVKQRGGRVILNCQLPLVPLLRQVDAIDAVVARGQGLPPFDCHASLLDLPRLFGTTPATVPGQAPYLQPDVERRQRWRAWLDREPGRKIGVCWRGNPGHPEDKRRSVNPVIFGPLADAPGVRLVALQVDHGREEMAQASERLRLLNPALTPDEQGEAFLELAALMSELDLVISVDTSIVHLAGALGVKTWVALPFVPDWRWLREREDTPWYPTLRLFRQQRRGEWDRVVARMAEELRKPS